MQSLVRIKGLEPPRREATDPKSVVATNYTISAYVQETKVGKILEKTILVWRDCKKIPTFVF